MNLPFHGIFLTARFPLAPQDRCLDIGRTMATALPQQCLPLSIVCGTSDGIMQGYEISDTNIRLTRVQLPIGYDPQKMNICIYICIYIYTIYIYTQYIYNMKRSAIVGDDSS
jgi:hypothetical protein